ncbi:MAG TPA: dTDP-4-dehydrorhamnose reductase [Acidimicrobiales bacterium]|nr:dTDP-4-dehydrorhamnose reductase [Acidimicrobiales bacterium]
MTPTVFVTGAGGQLGRAVVDHLRSRGYATVAADRQAVDVADRDVVMAAVVGARPDVVVHTAAWTAVDACEADPDRAFAVNALGTRHVAEAAAAVGAHLCYVSTDYVFDGTAERPYTEWDRPRPLSVYGRSKLAGEVEAGPAATVVRTSWVFGPHGSNMMLTVLRLAASGAPLRFVDDQRGSPSCTTDIAPVLCELALGRRRGVWHVTNAGSTTWFGFAREVAAAAGHDPASVEPIATAELDPPRPAPRPACAVLDNAALRLSGLSGCRPWQEAVAAAVSAAGVGR